MAKSMSLEQDPDLHRGFGEFTLPNGDIYIGDYCAHRSGVLWREGHGIYTTRDGQVYEGQWSDDKLVDNTEALITYPNGAQYSGPLVKNKYHGPGTYILECNMNVSCQFEANKPVGTVTLIDCQGRLWRGTAKENSAILLPENVFYLNLNEYKGRGVPRHPIDITSMLPSLSKCSDDEEDLPDKEWEKIIFAKSKLTENDVDFTDCKWWKNYENYRQKYDEITNKINEGISLNDEDYIWIERFKSCKRAQQLKNDHKQADWKIEEGKAFALNDRFQSKDFQNSCPGIKVFYPQQDELNNRTNNNSEEVIAVGDSNFIYVNSSGEITNPTTVVTVSLDLDVPEASSKVAHPQEEDISAFQLNELPDSNKTHPTPRCYIIPTQENSEEEPLHFTRFREEVLLERKRMLRKEEKYQADKARIRSKESLISRDKPERLSATKFKDGDLIKLTIAKPDAVTTPPKDFRAKIEMKVKECVDEFMASRKARAEKLKKITEQIVKKPHTHDVVVDTESITGIPRDLLLGNKSP